MELFEPINHGTYSFFSFQAREHPELATLMDALRYLGSYWVLLGLLAWAMWLLRWRRIGNLGLMVTIATVGIVEVLRRIIPHKRPPEAFDRVGADEMMRGFPSSSVLLACVVFYLAAVGTSRWIAYFVAAIAAAGVAMGQLWWSMHYLSDVIAGILGGLAVVFFLARRESEMRSRPLAA